MNKAGDFLTQAKPVQSGLALHFSCWATTLFQHQGIVTGFDYVQRLLNGFYRPLIEGGARPGRHRSVVAARSV